MVNGAVSKAVKNVLKHASAMRQAAVRVKVGGGHKPGSAIPKGEFVRPKKLIKIGIKHGKHPKIS